MCTFLFISEPNFNAPTKLPREQLNKRIYKPLCQVKGEGGAKEDGSISSSRREVRQLKIALGVNQLESWVVKTRVEAKSRAHRFFSLFFAICIRELLLILQIRLFR
jgi:hypothetical protein